MNNERKGFYSVFFTLLNQQFHFCFGYVYYFSTFTKKRPWKTLVPNFER